MLHTPALMKEISHFAFIDENVTWMTNQNDLYLPNKKSHKLIVWEIFTGKIEKNNYCI